MIFIDDFAIDAAIRISPSYTAQATSHPLESGAVMSDHIIEMPDTLTISGIVSDTPLGRVLLFRQNTSDPSGDAYDFLVDLHKEKRLVAVRAEGYPDFESMGLIRLTPSSDSRSGESLVFSATFQKMDIVDINKEDTIAFVKLPRQQRRKPKGAQAAETASQSPKTPDNTTKGNNDGSVKKLVFKAIGALSSN